MATETPINQGTTDLEQQRSLADAFISERFDKIRSQYSAEELFEASKSFAKSHLNEQLADAGKKLTDRDSRIAELERTSALQQQELERSSKLTAGLGKMLDDAQDFRRKQSVNNCIRRSIRFSKILGWSAGFAAFACSYSFVLTFFFQQWQWNHMEFVFRWMSSLPASRASLSNDALKLLLFGSQAWLYTVFYRRVIHQKSRRDAESEYREICEMKYKSSMDRPEASVS